MYLDWELNPRCEQECEWGPMWEDDILMGPIYYGQQCAKCGKQEYQEPGPLALGTYK